MRLLSIINHRSLYELCNGGTPRSHDCRHPYDPLDFEPCELETHQVSNFYRVPSCSAEWAVVVCWGLFDHNLLGTAFGFLSLRDRLGTASLVCRHWRDCKSLCTALTLPRGASDAQLQAALRCCVLKRVTRLQCVSCTFSLNGLEAIQALSKLEVLELLGKCRGGSFGLRGSFLNDIAYESLTDDFLHRIVGMSLRELDIDFNRMITDTGVLFLASSSTLPLTLQKLSMRESSITDIGARHLTALTSLRCLNIGFTSITDIGLEHLSSLTSLESLKMANTDITNFGLRHLVGLTSLEILALGFCHITDYAIRYLLPLSSLRKLYIPFTAVSDQGLADLSAMSSLKQLDVRGCDVSEEASRRFSTLSGCCVDYER